MKLISKRGTIAIALFLGPTFAVAIGGSLAVRAIHADRLSFGLALVLALGFSALGMLVGTIVAGKYMLRDDPRTRNASTDAR